ncbi:MAG TPA: tetratricopeptide repeat protein, partial [Usitatibacter sp.]|nr:tetratricopeptide repeat protein [Usitatibacter sp.]
MDSTTFATAARLYEAGDLAAARKLCEQLLQSDPNHFYALHLAAAIALREGRPEDTLHFASRALRIEPGHPEVLSNRGAALRAMCRFQEALADYDRALAAGAGPSTVANRGVALAALGRFRDALACYDAALAMNPNDSRARYNRGLARLTVGEFRDGWLDYESRWA